MDNSLLQYIETEIIPRYASFDRAHGIDHAKTVIAESLRLAEYYPVDRAMVLAAAAYHDLGLCEGRPTHHTVSGHIVREDLRLRQWFDAESIEIIACAVEDHRASAGHSPRSIYGRIVAEADRVINTDTTLRRTVQYGLANYPQYGPEEQFRRFRAHLHEKYAKGGYLQLYIPESDNKVRLTELRKVIADEQTLRSAFDRVYREETAAKTR